MTIYGCSTLQLDSKGLFALPPRFKALLSSDLLIMRHSKERCLQIHNHQSWHKAPCPSLKPFIQMVNIEDEYVCLAAQLMAYAQLEPHSECVIMGMGEHLELWNSDVWKAYHADNPIDLQNSNVPTHTY